MDPIDMAAFGLSDKLKALAGEYADLTVGRVLAQEKGLYRAICESGERLAETSGKFRHEAQNASAFPAVGDFVMLDCREDGGRAIIHHLLPRKSAFLRKAAGTAHREQVVAANIDTAFLCMSLNNDFNLRRLERYLSICWESGAKPVVILTKADLCKDTAEKRAAVEAVAMGVEILVVSALERDGYAQILPHIQAGRTIALIGSSGVGKSTLINRLIGEERFATDDLRSDDRGRHTTTRRELILLPNGGMVIDTPGMRELGIWDSAEGLDKAFSDVEGLSLQCRFRNCSHLSEPGCAVLAALESGALSVERWQSYQKLKTESAYAEDSQNYLAAKERKFKDIAKINKANKR